MSKQDNTLPMILIGAMVLGLVIIATLAISDNRGEDINQQQATSQQPRASYQEQVTSALTEEQKAIFKDITTDYFCNCGNCEYMVLYECDCSTPNGAQEVHGFMINHLAQGRTQEEMLELLYQNYEMWPIN